MVRVLVTGGAGYVGSHCCMALAEAGHQPVVYDNLSKGYRSFVRWGPLVEADIRDSEALRQAFKLYQPEAVMHFAALIAVGESVHCPELYYDVNIGGTLALLNAMRAAEVSSLVFSSTAAVYGEAEPDLITEDAALMPSNPYGNTKLACERMMEDFDAAHGIRSLRLRYFNAAGADQGAQIGPDHMPRTHLIPMALDTALGVRDSLQIFGDDYPTPDGTAIRDYIHVTDLATAHLSALNHLLSGQEGATLNLGTGQGASVREVIEAVNKVVGKSIPTEQASRRPGDCPSLVADPSRAHDMLDWQAAHQSLEIIVSDAWRWHQMRFAAATE